MRFRGVFWCFALAVVPQLALAEYPPDQMGALEAVYHFCVKVDPTQRAGFEREGAAVFKGLTEAQIAALRQSTEYKRGYQLLAGILPQLKNKDAVLACQVISGVVHRAQHGSQDPRRE